MKRNPFSQMTMDQLQKEAQKRMDDLKLIRDVLSKAQSVLGEINRLQRPSPSLLPIERRAQRPLEPPALSPGVEFTLVQPIEASEMPVVPGEEDEVFAQILEEFSES